MELEKYTLPEIKRQLEQLQDDVEKLKNFKPMKHKIKRYDFEEDGMTGEARMGKSKKGFYVKYKDWKEMSDYADRLVSLGNLPCLPADLENLRESNAAMADEIEHLRTKYEKVSRDESEYTPLQDYFKNVVLNSELPAHAWKYASEGIKNLCSEIPLTITNLCSELKRNHEVTCISGVEDDEVWVNGTRFEELDSHTLVDYIEDLFRTLKSKVLSNPALAVDILHKLRPTTEKYSPDMRKITRTWKFPKVSNHPH